MAALRLCLERLLPRRKDRLVQFELPPVRHVDEIPQATAAILAGVSEGNITPQEGETLSHILEVHISALTNQDLKRRLAS